jgi:hypothetical protein
MCLIIMVQVRMPTPWKKVFTTRPVIVIFIAQTTKVWGLYTLLNLLPKYFKSVLHFDMKQVRAYFCFLILPMSQFRNKWHTFFLHMIHSHMEILASFLAHVGAWLTIFLPTWLTFGKFKNIPYWSYET